MASRELYPVNDEGDGPLRCDLCHAIIRDYQWAEGVTEVVACRSCREHMDGIPEGCWSSGLGNRANWEEDD